MPSLKLYQSEVWLRDQLYSKRKSPEEIARTADCAPKTIYRYMSKYGLKN